MLIDMEVLADSLCVGGDGGARAGPVIFSRHSSSVLSLKVCM